MRTRTRYLLHQGTRPLVIIWEEIKTTIQDFIDLCIDYWFSTICFTIAIILWISAARGGK